MSEAGDTDFSLGLDASARTEPVWACAICGRCGAPAAMCWVGGLVVCFYHQSCNRTARRLERVPELPAPPAPKTKLRRTRAAVSSAQNAPPARPRPRPLPSPESAPPDALARVQDAREHARRRLVEARERTQEREARTSAPWEALDLVRKLKNKKPR